MLNVKPSDKPCFLCGKAERTVDVKFKNGTLSGVVCWDELYALMMKQNGQSKPAALVGSGEKK